MPDDVTIQTPTPADLNRAHVAMLGFINALRLLDGLDPVQALPTSPPYANALDMLHASIPGISVTVDSWSLPSAQYHHRLPTHVAAFIIYFEEGHYPKLEPH